MGADLVDERVQSCLSRLRKDGKLVEGTGCLESGATALWLHTDLGPTGQDKDTNQDYALAWAGAEHDDEPAARWSTIRRLLRRLASLVDGARLAEPSGRRRSLRRICQRLSALIDTKRTAKSEPLLILALADGLTSSHRSEWSAKLVCAVAVRTLAEELMKKPAIKGDGQAQALRAFTAAGRSLQEVAQAMADKPEESCPSGTFLSTWKYILRKGGLLQTTLTLAWVRDGRLRVAMLGDGGVLWRNNSAAPAPVDEILAQADLNTNTVNALGPSTPAPLALDFWVERPCTNRMVCALFSDGVGRGAQVTHLRLLDRVAELQAQGSANPAQDCIRRMVQEGHPAFDDNLTLAILLRK
jgi:plasmid stabilization system protein ParE